MTQEKELLLKDLCARLPYGVQCKWENTGFFGGGKLTAIYQEETPQGNKYWDCYFEDENEDIPIEIVRPYLRPMSSMTEEELMTLNCLCYHNIDIRDNGLCGYICGNELVDVQKFLLHYHFDFMDLISKGLAIEVTEENNPYKP